MARVNDGHVTLSTRNGFDWTHRLMPFAHAAKTLPARQAVLDGELVFLRPAGVSSFNDLLSAMRRGLSGSGAGQWPEGVAKDDCEFGARHHLGC